MLKFLHIENIAVIESSDIDFTEGLNVLTGETGAGKSIVIDAINAVLGHRTSKELIRAGCDSAVVTAVFGSICDSALKTLSENDIFPDQDGNVIISRKLSLNGKGIIKINGIPTTAGVLKDIGSYLINIHGQHDNQALLNPEKHIDYIDALADVGVELSDYYNTFKTLNAVRKELQSLELNEDEKAREISLLKFQINDIETANIKVGEREELKQKLEIAKSYETTISTLNKTYALLNGSDENDGAISLITNSVKNLNSLKNKEYSGYADGLSTALEIVQDISSNIGDFIFNPEYADFDVNFINQRLDLIDRIMLKYGGSEENVLNYLNNASKKLENINLTDKRVNELSAQLDDLTELLVKKAEILSEKRQKTALDFEKKVTEILGFLNMANVRFKVDFKKGRYTKLGCDQIEFLISANAGENIKPLHKIASGGELSRVMLAIKSILLDKDSVPTMIFDEIDTGISGGTASKVGVQLKNVSCSRQVLCVTHLAQIAAMADCHLLIEKNTVSGRTFTKVMPLSYEERISEIARIMSGTELTENLYNSAKELVDRSLKNENL